MTEVEICVDDVGGAAAAWAGGAGRVELCAGLAEGGTTPTLGFVRHCRRTAPELDVQVLVRPRPGDFVYSQDELDVMVDDIETVLAHAPGGGSTLGFTFGALTPAGQVDERAMARLVGACAGAPVTFHKAFDSVADQDEALTLIAGLGVAKVLTSGRGGPATENLELLASLVERAGQDIGIVVAGGVRPVNAATVVSATGAREIHLRAPRPILSSSTAAHSEYDAGTRVVTSQETVTAVVLAAAGTGGRS